MRLLLLCECVEWYWDRWGTPTLCYWDRWSTPTLCYWDRLGTPTQCFGLLN